MNHESYKLRNYSFDFGYKKKKKNQQNGRKSMRKRVEKPNAKIEIDVYGILLNRTDGRQCDSNIK